MEEKKEKEESLTKQLYHFAGSKLGIDKALEILLCAAKDI